MPSAPPRCASTAAQTGSGSYVRRASRSVATWSMLTPSSITALSFVVQCLQILHHAPALDAALLEMMIEHRAHQPLRLAGGLHIREPALGERDQRRAAHQRQRWTRLGSDVADGTSRSAVEHVMV